MKDLAKKNKNPFAYRQRHSSNESRVTERQMAHCNARPDILRGPEWIRTSSLMCPRFLRLTYLCLLTLPGLEAPVEGLSSFLSRSRRPGEVGARIGSNLILGSRSPRPYAS